VDEMKARSSDGALRQNEEQSASTDLLRRYDRTFSSKLANEKRLRESARARERERERGLLALSNFSGCKRERQGKGTFLGGMIAERASVKPRRQSCVYERTHVSELFVALHCSRIARGIGECPRNNLCCWASTASDVPYLDAR